MLYKNVVCIIQARTGSTRFPNKVLQKINGKSILQHTVERCSRAKTVDDVVIATTNNINDLAIMKDRDENYLNAGVYRGSEEDVLLRVLQSAEGYKKGLLFCSDLIIVDITADCPLVDPDHIDHLVKTFKKHDYDYISNVIKRSFPDGFDIQVYTLKALQEVNKIVHNKKHRSHSGWNIINYAEFFEKKLNVSYLVASPEYNFPHWGLTLDTKQDLKVLEKIFEHFKDNKFSAEQVMDYIKENPEVLTNDHIKRKIPGEG